MAGAMVAGIARYLNNVPVTLVVEPDSAACVMESIKTGKIEKIDIKRESLMGGMSCGDVSSIAWEILKNSSNYCLTISDEAISTTVALLAEKRLSDEKIIAGECAVPGIIALISSFNNKEYLDKLELNEQSNVLLFGCEGLTDSAMYQKLLSDGLQKI